MKSLKKRVQSTGIILMLLWAAYEYVKTTVIYQPEEVEVLEDNFDDEQDLERLEKTGESQKIDIDIKQEIETYMDEFARMYVSEICGGDQKVFMQTKEVYADDFGEPIELTVYKNEKEEDIRYKVQLYGETGSSVTDYYLCEDFIYVNQEKNYYSSQILTPNYDDVLYRETKDWIILDDTVYELLDDGEMVAVEDYSFYGIEEVKGWAESVEKPEEETEEKPESGQTETENRAGPEAAMLEALQTAVQHEIEEYVLADMDHDGAKEMIGAYRNEKNSWRAGYCSSDGKICEPISPDIISCGNDCCTLEMLDVGEETHIVFNCWNMMGNEKRYSVLALRDQKIICLVPLQYGYVWMSEEGDILLDVEDYDGMYEPNGDDDGIMTMHTWKDTYLYYEDGVYKEYGAVEMTETEFLSYQNAQLLKDKIEEELRQPDTVSMEYSYFRRKNGIIHIQCDVQADSGVIRFGYYTVRYQDKVLEDELGNYNPGRLFGSFVWGPDNGIETVY